VTTSPQPSANWTKPQPAPQYQPQPPGCIAWPARVIAVLIMVPLRLLWEAIALIGRFVHAYVLRPIGWLLMTLVVTPLRWLFLTLIVSPVRWLWLWLVVRPASLLYRAVLVPVGRALYRYLLTPVGRGLRRLVVGLAIIILTPIAWVVGGVVKAVLALYRFVRPALAAVGHVLMDALSFGGRAADAVVRFIGLVLYQVIVRPLQWLWRTLIRPVLAAMWWAWNLIVVSPLRWVTVGILRPIGAATRSVLRAMGVGGL
jgi:hypothetical protein